MKVILLQVDPGKRKNNSFAYEEIPALKRTEAIAENTCKSL